MTLTPEQREYLDGVHFAVVSTIAPDGMPHQTVMWYMLNGDKLLLNTPESSLKHRHLQADPRISVCVEDGYKYVTLEGSVTLDEDPTSAGADYAQLGERYSGTFAVRQSTGGKRPARLNRDRVTLHMDVSHIKSSGIGIRCRMKAEWIPR